MLEVRISKAVIIDSHFHHDDYNVQNTIEIDVKSNNTSNKHIMWILFADVDLPVIMDTFKDFHCLWIEGIDCPIYKDDMWHHLKFTWY